jgi:hypothetical protein
MSLFRQTKRVRTFLTRSKLAYIVRYYMGPSKAFLTLQTSHDFIVTVYIYIVNKACKISTAFAVTKLTTLANTEQHNARIS